MKRIMTIALLAGLFVGVCHAGIDPVARKAINDIRQGKDNKNAINKLLVKTTSTFEGAATFDVGVSYTVRTTNAAGLVSQSNIVLQSGEAIINSPDGVVITRFDDIATTLAESVLQSLIAATNISANDLFRWVGEAYDLATNVTEYGSYEVRVDVATNAAEASTLLLNGTTGGTKVVYLTLNQALARFPFAVTVDGTTLLTGASTNQGNARFLADVTADSNLTVTTQLDADGDFDLTGMLNRGSGTLSVTQNQEVAYSRSLQIVTLGGGTNTAILTNTLADPLVIGECFRLIMGSAATNQMFLDDSDPNLDLGGSDLTLGATDIADFTAIATNLWLLNWTKDN